MRWLIASLVLLLVAVGIAAGLQQDPGYIYLDIGRWTVETTVAFALVVVALAFVLVYLLLRALGMLLRSPRGWRRALRHRRTEQSRRSLTRG